MGAVENPFLSVVVPCFNEQEVLPEFYRRLSEVCRTLNRPYELVFINDGSNDQTWSILCQWAGQDPSVVAAALSRNHGHQLALTSGLTLARGQRVLIIDADLQDPPELLPAMLDHMDRGADVVYGQRRTRDGETRFKLATARLFYWLIDKLTDTPIPPNTGDFRLINRRVLDVLLKMPEHHRFMRGMVSWVGFEQVPLPYDRDARFAGETKYPVQKMVRFALDAITGFSFKPLRLATWLGILGTLFGFALIGYAIISWFSGRAVSGWTSLMTTIALFSSCQLIVLGVLGEYLARMYVQIQGRPLFMIKEVVCNRNAIHAPTADRCDRQTHPHE